MKYFPLSIVLTIALLLPAVRDVSFAQPHVQTGSASDIDVPRLSDLMVIVQMRHAKLWYSGSLKNWSLANYELVQIKRSLDEATRLYKNIPLNTIAVDTKVLDNLGEAVKTANEDAFVQSFMNLTSDCNDCHEGAGVGFIVIRVPTSSPFSNQSF